MSALSISSSIETEIGTPTLMPSDPAMFHGTLAEYTGQVIATDTHKYSHANNNSKLPALFSFYFKEATEDLHANACELDRSGF